MIQTSNMPAPRERLWRHLAAAAALALVFYVAGFWWIEHRRAAKGPWRIRFEADAAGPPSLQISQPTLRISERVDFPGDKAGRTNMAEVVEFKEATTNLPFGEMLMQDALYLPGTITLRLGGHRIEVLPRTLIIDKQEHPWKTGDTLVVEGKK
jgi:hypothetical protein